MNQRGFSVLLILVSVLILIGVSGASYYLGKSSTNNATTTPSASTEVYSAASMIPSPSALTSLLGEPKKRFFDANEKIFNSVNLPKELTEIGADNLHSLRCSPNYYRDDEKGRYVYDKDNPGGPSIPIEIKDEELILLAEKSFEIDFGAELYRACKIDDGRYILEYDKYAGGGGGDNKSLFGVLNTDKTFQKISEIPNDGAPYFGCSQVLQLTKSNILWYRCGGGDGGLGSVSIYKIDLSNKTHTKVIKCTSVSAMDTSGRDPEVKCEELITSAL